MPIVSFVDVSNMGEKALHSHADGKQHKKRLEDHKQVKSFFNPKNATDTTKEPNKTSEPVIITTPVDYVSAASSTPSNASHTKSLDACFQDSTCQKTEIMRAWKHAYNGLSDKFAKNVVAPFKTMFPDSETAEKMQLKPSKLKYVVNHGISSYVKEILKNQVKDTVWFVVSFDESISEVTQTSEMNIYLRFWNKENNRVEERYWDCKFFGHTTPQHLLDSVHEGLKVFDMAKIWRNWKNRETNFDLLNCLILVDIVHGAFKSVPEASGWDLKKLLKPCFQLLKDTQARRDDFISITESTKLPLQFCGTRFFKLFVF